MLNGRRRMYLGLGFGMVIERVEKTPMGSSGVVWPEIFPIHL
jgi:hypothetical protein